jgi:hypothetical protein
MYVPVVKLFSVSGRVRRFFVSLRLPSNSAAAGSPPPTAWTPRPASSASALATTSPTSACSAWPRPRSWPLRRSAVSFQERGRPGVDVMILLIFWKPLAQSLFLAIKCCKVHYLGKVGKKSPTICHHIIDP